MIFNLYPSNSLKAACMIGLTLSLSLLALPTMADEIDNRTQFPGRRIGGGSRGCDLDNKALVAFVPASNLVKTTAALPEFVFALPQAKAGDPLTVNFVLQDAQGRALYQSELTTTEEQTRIQVTPTADLEALAVGETYNWFFSVVCSAEQTNQNPIVFGSVQRVEPEGIPVVGQQSPSFELIQQYQAEGLWNDALITALNLEGETTDSEQMSEVLTKLIEQASFSLPVDPAKLMRSK
ncbi:MAG: DUF928 domain-containing protein [Prochlorotrichaceae cyanobacterium]|jgi:hypothetical protein